MSDSSSRDPREAPARAAFCFGFGPWKFGFVRAYLRACGLEPRFCAFALDASLRGFDGRCRAVVWGLRETPALRRLAAAHSVTLWRMEDGFLRSVGLGSDFTVPASLVLDRTGIYFDPTRPSDLETLLESGVFSPEELARAGALRELIVRAALSKYNFASDQKLERPAGKRVLLVPGQVEDDASIRLGCVDIRTNEALLAEVRAQNPDAHVIYKPHPDLLRGNRKAGALAAGRARELCDQLISAAPLPACLAIADEVHTMTSLAGFEALLRGLPVVTYGRPFYAGWGLTRDRHRCERRTRRLTLDMLVAGALLRYPMYLSRQDLTLTTPEQVIAELVEELRNTGTSLREARWKRQARKLGHAIRGIFDGA